jgi:methylamine dehydrogenase accessory protein MauD
MTTALIIAVIVQWIFLMALAALVFALLRQVGVLHERLGPVGALMLPGGPQPGMPSPKFDLIDLDGRAITIGGHRAGGVSTLLFFLSPTCPICKSLLPVLLSIAAEEGERLRLVFASDGDEPAQRDMVRDFGLADYSLVLSTALGLAFEVSKLPHAVLIDAEGRVVAKGLVNNREHLESLFEARNLGVATRQDYARARQQSKMVAG